MTGRPIHARRPGRLRRLRLLLARHPRVTAAASVLLFVAGGLVALAVRAELAAARLAAHAQERMELGRRLGQEIERMEWRLRVERMLPLHDVGPAEVGVRERLASVGAMLGGGDLDGPIYTAMGRG